MRIKLAILEQDQVYLQRIVAAFNTKYSENLEIYSFTDKDIALSTLDSARIDVMLAAESYDIDMGMLPQKCGFAYFVDSADIESFKDQRAICKFQKADLIYKQILSVYSEKAEAMSGIKLGDESARIFAFMSPAGGTGASTAAASAAIHFASRNYKTLYLNLEKLGSSDDFFFGDGQFDMSDIVFALKSKKTNLPLKLESCVKQDNRGVYFYSQTKIALDMYELKNEDILRLITELRLLGTYDYIILDMDFGIDSAVSDILKQVHSIVWVSDGSEIANTKTIRAFNALSILDQTSDLPLINRTNILYNKFSSKSSRIVNETALRMIGGAPRYDHSSTAQILEQLSKMDIFDKI